MKPFAIDRTNGLCAALFIFFGAFFAIQSLGLEIGTAFRMGPGYFPLVLAIVLIVLGAIILVQAVRVEHDQHDRQHQREIARSHAEGGTDLKSERLYREKGAER